MFTNTATIFTKWSILGGAQGFNSSSAFRNTYEYEVFIGMLGIKSTTNKPNVLPTVLLLWSHIAIFLSIVT